MMWLPTVERKLLAFYAMYDSEFRDSEIDHSFAEIRPVLHMKFRDIKEYTNGLADRKKRTNCESETDDAPETNMSSSERKYMKWLRDLGAIESANTRLHERNLIQYIERGQHCYGITLKLSGWDLGNQYNCWFTRSGLRFREHKDHWIWIVISFLSGILGGALVNWVSQR